MATESITDGVVDPIGLPPTVNTLYQNTNNIYDIAVGGLPFYLAASNAHPYHRETASYKRQQLDLTQQPGEQTFEGWWLRSQSSWHLGAGINYLEPLQGADVIYRFNKSVGINPWTPGQISLLNDVTKVFTLSGTAVDMIGGIDANNVSVALVSSDATLTRITSTGATGSVVYGGSGSNISSLTQDGTNYYAANASGIYKGALTGVGTGSKIWDTGSTKAILNWVKQRLIAGIDNKLYYLPNSNTGSTTLPTGGTAGTAAYVAYTHPNTNWTWTAIAEGPTGVYASGYAGTESSIVRLTLETTGLVPVLTAASTAADFPSDEHVTSFSTYLGKFALIGTNKGIRVGVLDTNGYISYGPLTYTTTTNDHVSEFAFRDRFAYGTVTNEIDGKSGLVRIDLSQQVSDGKFAYATDLNSNVTGDCRNAVYVGESGVLAFTVVGNGVYFQNSNKVASGYIDTGFMRYNTIEKKHFKFVKVLPQLPMDGAIAVSRITKDGTVTSIITLPNDSVADQDLGLNLTTAQEQLAFRFTLYRNGSDSTKGAGMVGYQTKALPANRRTRYLSIPLASFDFESDRYNIQTGYEGRAWDRLAALENVDAIGNTITIQDFTTGEQVEDLIEKITFDRTAPPDRRFMGFGGIIYVQARTL